VYEVPNNLDFGFKLRWKFTFSQHLWYLLGRRLGGPESHSVCGSEEKILPLSGTEFKSNGEGHKEWTLSIIFCLTKDTFWEMGVSILR
jgi:hypothetical protein